MDKDTLDRIINTVVTHGDPADAEALRDAVTPSDHDTLTSLTEEYDRWLEQTGHEPQSADELYCELLGRDNADADHLEWLSQFTRRWEAAEDREREAHAAGDMTANQETSQPSAGPSIG